MLKLHTPEYPLPNSSKWTASGEWSNLDIDNVTQHLQTTNPQAYILNAMFLLNAQENPDTAKSQLQAASATVGSTGTIHMVCWVRHHWLLACFAGETMHIADSSPGIATENDLRTIANFAGAALDKNYDIKELRVPIQPKGSVECGAHVAANIFLAQKGWLWTKEFNDKTRKVVTYAQITETFKLYSEGELRTEYVEDRILETLGDTFFSLPTNKQILERLDAMNGEMFNIRWWTKEGIKKWSGKLIKRHPTHWTVQYPDLNHTVALPQKDYCYLTIENTDEQTSLSMTHQDVLSLNVRPPSSTAKVEGDSITLRTLKNIISQPRQSQPYDAYFSRATAPSTRRQHIQLLNKIADMPNGYDNHKITEAIPQHMMQQKLQRKWKASTCLTKLAAIQGLMKVLPFYIPTAPSILLGSSPRWRTTLRGASISANEEPPHQSKPLSSLDLQATLAATQCPAMHACLELAWLTAGRIGDIIQLTPQCVTIDEKEKITMVKFLKGKTARMGAYSVAVPQVTAKTAQFIQSKRQQPYLFPTVTQTGVKESLRNTCILYECRSIRRGRLQELSLGGMSDQGLLHISRHSTISSLRRYLDFGLASGENVHRAHLAAKATIEAARKLQTNEHLPTSSPMGPTTAPQEKRSNVPSPSWDHGSESDSLSDPSTCDDADGNES